MSNDLEIKEEELIDSWFTQEHYNLGRNKKPLPYTYKPIKLKEHLARLRVGVERPKKPNLEHKKAKEKPLCQLDKTGSLNAI